VKFVGEDGSIIVPKSVRPIIEYPSTSLGNLYGALRQFRNGRLHIREYNDYYSVHLDSIDPLHDPIGHLIVDAPEYLVGIFSGISIFSAIRVGASNLSKNDKRLSNSLSKISSKAGPPACIAAILAACASYTIAKSLKKLTQRQG
jgi:hypothetical protein